LEFVGAFNRWVKYEWPTSMLVNCQEKTTRP
jgi:hypothetical protein